MLNYLRILIQGIADILLFPFILLALISMFSMKVRRMWANTIKENDMNQLLNKYKK